VLQLPLPLLSSAVPELEGREDVGGGGVGSSKVLVGLPLPILNIDANEGLLGDGLGAENDDGGCGDVGLSFSFSLVDRMDSGPVLVFALLLCPLGIRG